MAKRDWDHWVAAMTVWLAVAVCLGIAPHAVAAQDENVFDQLDLLVDVRHEIVHSYVEDPDQQKMTEQAVRAMVASLDDRYTVFLTTDELDPFDKQVRGTFSGIGAEIDLHNERLRIVSPLEESPAWNSGVLAGDLVLEINGESTEGITIREAVNKLTGPEGTQVTIKVRHETGDEETITITRARINVQTVRGIRRDADNHWVYMLDPANQVGYIRITQFTDSTAQSVRAALDQLLDQGAKGLILDLRFNPGGLLESAVAISDFFLDGDKRIVSVKGRVVPERVRYSTNDTTIQPLPLVVLANEASASASEIVTGALLDNGRAVFIGTRTFGKGSVQQVKMLDSGLGAIKITHAYYYLPNGRNIHRRSDDEVWGVDPADGYYVPMSPDQAKKMIEIRRESGFLRAGGTQDLPDITPEWIEQEMADLQLAAALRAMVGKLTTGDWPIVGQSDADQLARLSQRENLKRQRDLLNERLEWVEEELAKLDDPDASNEEASEPDDLAADEGQLNGTIDDAIDRALEDAVEAPSPEPDPLLESSPSSDDSSGTAKPTQTTESPSDEPGDSVDHLTDPAESIPKSPMPPTEQP